MRELLTRYKLPLITLATELGPFCIFFITNNVAGFFEAIVATIVATFAALIASWMLARRVPWFAIVGGATLLFFGLLSIYTRSEDVFIVQDTITSVAFGLILLATVKTRKPLLEFFFAGAFALTKRGWRTLTLRWGILFLLIGISNELVRITATPNTWVYFKAFTIVLIALFGMYQFTLSRRERIPEESTPWGLRIKPSTSDSSLE